ncbi:terpene synthase family protein [Embleya sp. MST-111070]|uniref:terpene synthase family protein n=1 Tax=Embleya sp. MST-111070 TaxID=3398231 RepID=UPI003F739445
MDPQLNPILLERTAPVRPGVFRIPFTRRVSPDVDRAATHHAAWLLEHGMVRSPRAIEGIASWDIALVCGVVLPHLRGADLRLCTDWMGWAIIFDDLFDGAVGSNPRTAAEVIENLADIVHGDPENPPHVNHPAESALVDLIRRTGQRMSAMWCNRMFNNTLDWLTAMSNEATQRRVRRVWTFDEYMIQRRNNVWARGALDLVEIGTGYELPDVIHNSWEFDSLRTRTVDGCAWMNDIYSLPKDITRNDPSNAVLVLEQERGMSRADATRHVVDLTYGALAEYRKIKANLPALFGHLGLSAAEREGCLRWMAAVDQLWIGANDFHLYHPRYRPETMAKPVKDDFLDDLHLAPEQARRHTL